MKQIKKLNQEIKRIDSQIKGLSADLWISDEPDRDYIMEWMKSHLDRDHGAWIVHRADIMKRRAKQKNLWPIGCFCAQCQAKRR